MASRTEFLTVTSPLALDQAMLVEHGLDRRDRRPVNFRIQPGEPFPDLGRSPARSLPLQPDDQRLNLDGQLIGVAAGPARAIREPFVAAVAIALEDFIPGFREMPKSSQRCEIASPSSSRAMNFTRSSMM